MALQYRFCSSVSKEGGKAGRAGYGFRDILVNYRIGILYLLPSWCSVNTV